MTRVSHERMPVIDDTRNQKGARSKIIRDQALTKSSINAIFRS
jgi:hypothetical protein